MAMIDIEYRYSGRPVSGEVRRADWEEMEKYLRGLVYEMQEADISSKYVGTKTEDEDMLVMYTCYPRKNGYRFKTERMALICKKVSGVEWATYA